MYKNKKESVSSVKGVRMIKAPRGKKLSADDRWNYANFTDHFIFSTVLKHNEQITRDFIKLFVPDLHIKKIRSIHREKRQDAYHDSKTTYLDVEVELPDDTRVMIEMQVLSVEDFIKRMRYYRSEADFSHLEHGGSYGSLPNVIQIVVCLFDPVGAGRYLYDYEMRDRYTGEALAQNGQRIIFLNCKGYRGEITDEQLEFVNYLRGEEAFGNLIENIDAAVCEIKYDESEKKKFMKLQDYVSDRTDIAREEGREEGRKEGIEEKEKEDLSAFIDVLKSMGTEEETAISLISEKFGKSPEEIRKILIMQEQTH